MDRLFLVISKSVAMPKQIGLTCREFCLLQSTVNSNLHVSFSHGPGSDPTDCTECDSHFSLTVSGKSCFIFRKLYLLPYYVTGCCVVWVRNLVADIEGGT